MNLENTETTPGLEENSQRSYYLIRSCKKIPFENEVVGIGYGEMEFHRYQDGDAIIKEAPNKITWSLGRRANQIRRFKAIRKGDVIVFPFNDTMVIGIAKGEECYDPTYSRDNGSNQHRVAFLRNSGGKVLQIPRVNLSEALQRRFKIRIAVANLDEFRNELDAVIADHKAGRSYSWMAARKDKDAELEESTKAYLLNQIRWGGTGIATGGIGLEHLVKELLEISGFEAKILGTRSFSGLADADIKASRNDIFHPEGKEEFLIQVKHHDGKTGLWGQQQLAEIKKDQPEKFAGIRLVLITSGKVDETDDRFFDFAEENSITVLSGEKLVDWIFDSVDRLRPETRLRLGISKVPQMIRCGS
ncbi:MAG TPA: restriction endonuclease [Chthoniobacteraceae bacterium]|nr:restriction endonuclease [Chthoniobacteraceae bacterium]